MATICEGATKEDLIRMMEAGMSIARFDASHDKSDFKNAESSLQILLQAVDEYNEKRQKEILEKFPCDEEFNQKFHIATALDLIGSFFETGIFDADRSTPLAVGDKITLTTDATKRNAVSSKLIFVNFQNLLSFKPNQVIILNKKIHLIVEGIDHVYSNIDCTVSRAGELTPNERMEVNLPGVDISPASNSDITSVVKFCKRMNIDMIIVPASSPETLLKVKCLSNADGSSSTLKVIAKLEGIASLTNVDRIIEQADGVLICRSRLGRNTSPEQVSSFQRDIVSKCLKAGVPSIIAEDLIQGTEEKFCDASRAEIADIVKSVLNGADCLMLGERVSTLSGVSIVSSTIKEAEAMVNHRRLHWKLTGQVDSPYILIPSRDFPNSISIAACTSAMLNEASAIVVLSVTGKTARLLSKYRPNCPIICVCPCATVARQVLMHRGVFSVVFEESMINNYSESVEKQIQTGIAYAKRCLLENRSGVIVAVLSAGRKSEKCDTLRVIKFGNDDTEGEAENQSLNGQ